MDELLIRVEASAAHRDGAPEAIASLRREAATQAAEDARPARAGRGRAAGHVPAHRLQGTPRDRRPGRVPRHERTTRSGKQRVVPYVPSMAFVGRVLAGDVRSIARLLSSRAESGRREARAALDEIYRHTGRAHVVGHHRRAGQRQIDARRRSSRRQLRASGRKHRHRRHRPVEPVFRRRDPRRPHPHGRSCRRSRRLRAQHGDSRRAWAASRRATLEAVDVLDAAGYDMVIIETVGVGQDEVDVARAAHTTVVVSAPGLGDDIQAIKAGILEIADVHVGEQVRPARCEQTVAELKGMLVLGMATAGSRRRCTLEDSGRRHRVLARRRRRRAGRGHRPALSPSRRHRRDHRAPPSDRERRLLKAGGRHPERRVPAAPRCRGRRSCSPMSPRARCRRAALRPIGCWRNPLRDVHCCGTHDRMPQPAALPTLDPKALAALEEQVESWEEDEVARLPRTRRPSAEERSPPSAAFRSSGTIHARWMSPTRHSRTSACRAGIRSPAAPTRPCTAAGSGPCARSPASAPPRTRTSASSTSIAQGQTGLSTDFDMPTLMGYDSDHPMSEGEVGREGVAIDTLADMEHLFDGIDLEKISVSMTINPSAWILLAMYIALAQKRGHDLDKLSGTIQADILKEYMAQKEWVFPIAPSVRIVRDCITYCAEEHEALQPDQHLRLPHLGSRLARRSTRSLSRSATSSRTWRRCRRRACTSTPSRRGWRFSSSARRISSRRSPSSAPCAGCMPR